MTGASWVSVNGEWLADVRRRADAQSASRQSLAASTPLSEQQLRKMDSTLKKTTAVMKKIKMLNKENAAGLKDDLDKINLSKFVEEMAMAVADSKFKISDLPNVIDLCVAMSARYADFSGELLAQMRKQLPSKKTDKTTNPSKLRVDLRLVAELLLHGVFGKEGLQALGTVISVFNYQEKTEHPSHSLIQSLFSSVGWELAGVIPSTTDSAPRDVNIEKSDLPMSDALTEEQRKTMRDVVGVYWKSLSKRVNELCDDMNRKKKMIRRQERTKGDASSEDKSILEQLRIEWIRWREAEKELSIVLGEEPSGKIEDPSEDESDEEAIVELSKALEEGSVSLWPDADARSFYENVLALRKIVPAALFKDVHIKSNENDGMASCIDDVDLESLEQTMDDDSQTDCTNTVDDDDGDSSGTLEPEEYDREPEEERERRKEEEEEKKNDNKMELVDAENSREKKESMDAFLSELRSMTNRENIDNAALEYVNNCLHTSINRRRLKHFMVKCARPDVLPFYARFLSTIDQVMHDFVAEVCTLLLERLRDQLSHHSEYVLSERISTTIFIGEMIKFGIIPRAEGLVCLKLLVFDFRFHAIEMLCTFVENVGFYLYRSPDSHAKMKTLLEVMLKKKKRLKDVRLQTLLDNAYFSVLPPEEEAGTSRGHSLPPMLRFIRRLVTSIEENKIVANLRCIRRLDWTDPLIADYTIALLSSPWLVSLSSLPHLASLVGGLNEMPRHDWIAVAVADNILETIRLSLEKPRLLNQEAMSCIIYLGELYNFCVCNSQVIFKTLYQLISFPESVSSWRDMSRVRLVAALIEPIGEFFRGSRRSTSNMMCFLAYFYRFYWMKREQWKVNAPMNEFGVQERFPQDVEGKVRELHKMMLKGRKEPSSLADAEESVRVVETSFKAKVDAVLASVERSSHHERQSSHYESRRLNELREEDEDDEETNGRRRLVDDDVLVEEETLFGEQYDEEDGLKEPSPVLDDEDEEFSTLFDRMVTDSLKAPIQHSTLSSGGAIQAAAHYIPAAKERLARDVEILPPTSSSSDHVLGRGGSGSTTATGAAPSVAVLLRGRNNKATLRAVDVREERLERSWRENKEKQALERAHLKQLTLAHQARQFREEEAAEVSSSFGGGLPRR